MAKEIDAFVVAWSDYDCTICINGTRYVYQSYSYSGYVLKSKFEGMAKHSPGRAIQWIKENARVTAKYGVEEN